MEKVVQLEIAPQTNGEFTILPIYLYLITNLPLNLR